jgi:hypothetical protein
MTVRATANARALASRQVDQFRSHIHGGTTHSAQGASGGNLLTGASGQTTTAGGTETRPVNTAYLPRIHA